MDKAKIYLCKADRSLLGTITGIKTETCTLKRNATDLWELTFEVERYIDTNGRLVQSDYYDSIDDMMKLYLDGNDIHAFFVIDSEPVIKGEELQEIKTVTAHSIECELNDIYLKSFKINCGTSDSLEYLATDQAGNFNNINPYTGLPYEYISLVNYENTQLSLLHLALQGTGWTVKENIDSNVCRIKQSFEISNNSVYSFFMKTVSPAASVIFEFDRKHRQVGIVKADNYGKDTGVFISMRNLMNSFEVTSSSDDKIKTKLLPLGKDNLGIEYANFGKDYIINLDYFMNTLNEYGDYKYVSTELHNKYNTWKKYRETELVVYDNKEYTRRELYRELTKRYNQTLLDISEIHNRLPNDGCLIDYTTYSLDDLKISFTAYNNALLALITLYKKEYGVTEIGNAPNYMPVPSSATNIKDTPYWYDFYAYKEKIIPQVEEALKMYCKTDSNGNLVSDSDGHFIELEFGNPNYYSDETIIKNIDSFLYELSLYGLDELESKKKAWAESANILFSECFILSGTVSNPTAYRTPDVNGWNSLSSAQKSEFTTQSAFIDRLNKYLDYMSFNKRQNSLTNTVCKGIIRQCNDAIMERMSEISAIEEKQKEYQLQRSTLADSVTLEHFTENGTTFLFSEEDLFIISSMLREQEYTNDNIITTNLDDVISTVDNEEELYQAAIEELYRISQPQYSFSTELDNLYALDEFKSYQESFDIGNFIRVGLEIHEDICENIFIKLRLISIKHNPLEISENISVEFSTMTKSLNGISDIAFLLDKESSAGGSSSSTSSSNSGTYGNNDASVQISNNMLNALLSTELFGTAVTDVMLDSIKANKGNFNTLFSHSGIFDSLEAGQIKISGDCLFDIIKSNNWNGNVNNLLSNTEGSIMDLSNGKFSFAGGKLKWDGAVLTVDGNGKFTGDISGATGTFSGSINVNNKFVVDNNGNVVANGTLKASNANITGIINATSGNIQGDITANTLTAKKNGSIAGWNFNSNAFYRNNSGITENGMYLGKDGISIDDYFVVKHEGMYVKSKDWTPPTFTNQIGKENGFLVNLIPGQWVKIYIYNVKDIDYFEMSWQYDLGIAMVDTDGYASALLEDSNNYTIAGWGINGRTEKADAFYLEGENIVTFTRSYDELYKESDYSSNTSIQEDIKNGLIPKVEYISINRFYSVGRNISGRYFNSVQIGKVEIYNQDNTLNKVINGTQTNALSGMMINTFYKHIYTDVFHISNEKFSHSAVYNSTVTNSSNLFIDSSGQFMRSASSSKRYKTDITSKIAKEISPEKLYDLDIVSYKYKNDYLSNSDERYGKEVIGLIAEDVYNKYPIACNLDNNGKPEMWNINILFPAALKLIQKQHKEIETIKRQFQDIKARIIS